MDTKILEKVGMGLIMAGVGYLLATVVKMPEKELQDVAGLLDSGDTDGVIWQSSIAPFKGSTSRSPYVTLAARTGA